MFEKIYLILPKDKLFLPKDNSLYKKISQFYLGDQTIKHPQNSFRQTTQIKKRMCLFDKTT